MQIEKRLERVKRGRVKDPAVKAKVSQNQFVLWIILQWFRSCMSSEDACPLLSTVSVQHEVAM